MKNIKKPFGHYISKDTTWFTISNILTLVRVACAPIIMGGIYYQMWTFTFWLFIFACVTDLLDGHIARFLNQQTVLGSLLDPVADKVFILACFYSLVFFDTPSFQIPVWFFIMECIRELTILGGAYFLMHKRVRFQISPTKFGKLTTFFQLLFITWLFICRFFVWNPVKTFVVFLIFLTLFSLWSLFHYITIGWVYLKNEYFKSSDL